MYESWPGNSIDLYAWYQTRNIRMCGGWVSTITTLPNNYHYFFDKTNRSGTHVDLAGGDDIAGVLLILAGQ